MDFLNYNSVETLPGYEARAAFTVNSASVFKEDVDIMPTIVDDTLSYIPWDGDNLQLIDRMGDNQMPFFYLNCFGVAEQLSLQRNTTEKVKTDRSIATLGKTSCFYDVTTSKEYEVESAALTSDECLQIERYTYLPLVRCSTPATLSTFPFGNPTALSSNSEIVSLCDTIFTEAGATSSCFPPASAVKSATAASSKSTTLKYFCI